MIETLPCGCCKTKKLQSNFLRVRNELFKGNVVFFDNPTCPGCCTEPESFYIGQMLYLNGVVLVEMKFPLISDEVLTLEWPLEVLKDEVNKMISYKFDFSYIRAKATLNGNVLKVRYLAQH